MKTTNKFKSLIVITQIALAIAASAQDYSKSCTIEMQAQVSSAPAKVILSWPLRSDIKNYALQRKAPGTSLVSVALAATTTGYTDTTAAVGVCYDYKLIGYPLISADPTSYGYVCSGIDLPLVENRGRVLLVIASNIATPVAPKINRLVSDLVGEGWAVEQMNVAPTDTVASVKAQIVARHASNPLKSLFLIGHVPVPYSGNINPDSHPEHKGAWPCDGFYGDMDTNLWTDSTVNNATAARAENFNVPGDGKYDQSTFPSAVELSVGRVDFANLPSFAPLSEVDLLNRYLDKDHNFRTGDTTVARRGIVDDNLATMREALGASSRRAICGSFGASNVIDGDFATQTTASLFGTGIGYGSYSSIEGVGTTASLAAGSVNTVFNHHFGSYFGDWDSADNILRGVIAANGASLTSMWTGRSVLHLNGMAAGRTVGECVQASMNQGTDAYIQIGYNLKSVHLSLMGDPTLRLLSVGQVSNVKAEISNGAVSVTWAPSPAAGLAGYHVYRASAAGQPFVRCNASLIAGTSYSDASATAGTVYMVSAVKLETTCSSSFSISSVGVTATATATADPIAQWKSQYFGAQASNDLVAGDTADFDKDGVCNLMEYAMGSNPADSSSKCGLTNVCVSGAGAARQLCANYSLCSTAPGVKITIQCSSDLQVWNTAPASTQIGSTGGYTHFQVAVSATASKCFLRALVQRI